MIKFLKWIGLTLMIAVFILIFFVAVAFVAMNYPIILCVTFLLMGAGSLAWSVLND